MENNIWYSSQQLLSHQRLYNIICGVRGHGKTYDTSKLAIDTALKTKKISFIVLCRYKEDIKEIKDSWWTVVENLYPDWKFCAIGKTIYAYNDLQRFAIGEYVAISEYKRAKRVPRPYVKYIIFDEFLNEDNDYLDREVDKFLSICDSIIRNRNDVKVLLISNTITVINPYFAFFNFTNFGKRFTKGLHNSIMENTDSEKFQEYRKTTEFGKSIVGTGYGDYAISGQFMLDDMTNVIKNPKGTYTYLYNIMLHGQNISVYVVNNLLFLAKCKDYTRRMYTPYVDDAKCYGALYCDKNFKVFREIQRHFIKNEIMYEELKIKNATIELVKFMIGGNYNR